MKRIFLSLVLIFLAAAPLIKSQDLPDAEVFLITCGPGTETYSLYGHSAIRIVIPSQNSDLVYNWGVFDFSTPNFAWKFAKGRLVYMLGVYPYKSFLEEYMDEKRWVVSQKVNLEKEDIAKLFVLLADNLKPENVKYHYDFFYDNCSTRIRDLFEKIFGDNLIYPPAEPRKALPTFRNLIDEYQKGYSWLNLGIDLLVGSPADKKATFRDRMFLPINLRDGLSELTVRRGQTLTPLLQNPKTMLDFPAIARKEKLLESPLFVFSMLLIILVIFTAVVRKPLANQMLDIFLFLVFSVLAALMIFFNFFTDHVQTRWNLNIIWLNPFVFMCLASLVAGKNWQIWFRTVFYLALIFLASVAVLPQHINDGMFPVIVIMILRSSIRSGFSWNPLNLPYLTQL